MKTDNAVRLENISIDDMWKLTSDKYIRVLNKSKELISKKEFEEDSVEELMKNIQTFINKCSEPEFQIAFVGAIKAGKSTLINAILGRNLASTAVTPETAALTKFRSTKNRNYIKLEFYTKEEWDKLISSVKKANAEVFYDRYKNVGAENKINHWVDHEVVVKEFDDVEELKIELEKWTSSKKETHFFVKSVEVGLGDLNIPEGVVIVDTPGLDDPVEYRSDITRKYIDNANAVLVCVKSDALTGAELSTIYRVFANSRHNLEKIFIVGTQMDTLNRPIKNWAEQKEEWVGILKSKSGFGSEKLARRNIIGVAAYINCLINQLDESVDEEELFEVKNEINIQKMKYRIPLKFDEQTSKNKLLESSGIVDLKELIRHNVINKYKKLQLEDLTESYNNINKSIALKFNKIIKTEEDIIEAQNKSKEELLEKIKEAKSDFKRKEEENKENRNRLKEIEKYLGENIEEIFINMNRMMRE